MAYAVADIRPSIMLCRKRCRFVVSRRRRGIGARASNKSPAVICCLGNPAYVPTLAARKLQILKSVEVEQYLASGDGEEEMGEGFFEAIEELERMTRDPSDVLGEMNDRLSTRELQLVLVYFSQEGRDSWCALEVFDWLRKENKVDQETLDLMVTIMCDWIKKLIVAECDPRDVVDLLVDMDCVGLRPAFSMLDKVVSLYWETGYKDSAASFVQEVLRRGVGSSSGVSEGMKGGPAGYLVWKMMGDGNYREAAKFVIHLREFGLKPDDYSYIIAMTAIVKELNEFAKALRRLKGFARSGLVSEVDAETMELSENYQSDLLADGICLSNWAIQEGKPSVHRLVYERRLAMYICAGRGLDAERQLLELQLIGKEVDADLYDAVLAICASQKEEVPILRLLSRLEMCSVFRRKRAFTWLLRGYVKGGHFVEAADALRRMLDMGLLPDYLDRVAVMQGLGKRIHQANIAPYLQLCRRLCDANLITPPLLSLYINKYKLWIMRMI